MSTKKILLVLVALIVIGGGIFAVNQFNKPKTPNEIIRASITNALKLDSVAFDGTIKAKAEEIQDLSGNAEIKLAGKVNEVSKLIPNLDYTLSVNGSVIASGQKLDGAGTLELRFVEEKPYLKISNVTPPKELAAQIEPMLAQFKDKWFVLPFDAKTAEQSVSEKETKLLNDIKGLIGKYDFITVTKDLGIENGQHHFEGKLNPAEIRKFSEAVAKKSGESVEAQKLTELEQVLSKLDAKFELWIGVADLQLYRESGTLTVTDPAGQAPGKLVFDFDLTIKDHNKTQTIEAPANATPFDPAALLGTPAQ